MSAAAEVLAELTAHGVRARAVAGNLHLAPPSALTTELLERVRAAKPELLRMLAPDPLKHGLAIREVLSLSAVLLPRLPIATTLVLVIPGVTEPVLVATHRDCPRRSFAAHEWLALIALAEVGSFAPSTFARWARGTDRDQLKLVGASAAVDGSMTVGRVLSRLCATLRAVVLEG